MSARTRASTKPKENAANVYTTVFLAAIVKTFGSISHRMSGWAKFRWILPQSARKSARSANSPSSPYIAPRTTFGRRQTGARALTVTPSPYRAGRP